MTDEELAVKAAHDFMAAEPAFIAIPENSQIIIEYFQNHAELNPIEISSYHQAFAACRDRLRLEHHFSAEEYKHRIVLPLWTKAHQEKPQPSETDALLKECFESCGCRDSMKNRAAVNNYMKKNGINDFSLENLSHAIQTVSEFPGLELSDAAIEAMPASEYKKHIEREFKEQQAKQKPTESSKPLGVSWAQWLNSR